MNTTVSDLKDKRPEGERGLRWGWWLAVLAVVAGGVTIDRWADSSGRPWQLADAQRLWIGSSAGAPEEGFAEQTPKAFWAVRDFVIDPESLAAARTTARLYLIGDPQVLVLWNGVLVHAEHYQPGQRITALDVGGLLEPRNRLILEARSERGGGGLLAALWLDPSAAQSAPLDSVLRQPLWVTDSSWRLTETVDESLLRGLVPLSGVELLEPEVWSGFDLGRWQPLRVAERVVDPSFPSRRLRIERPVRLEFRPSQPSAIGEEPTWPPGVLVDFGQSVEGCLGLSVPSVAPRRVYFLERASLVDSLRGPLALARLNGEGPAAVDARVVRVEGARRWLDTTPRRFEAVLLEGGGQAEVEAGGSVWVQPCAAEGWRVRPTANRLRWKDLVGGT